MADTFSTTATLDNLLSTYLVRQALPRLVARAVLYQFAEKVPLPKGAGATTVRWNGWTNFTPVTGALSSEGTSADLKGTSSRRVEATIAQYGRGVKPTTLAIETSSLPVIEGIAKNLTDSAGLSVDKVIQMGIFKPTIAQNTGTVILSVWASCVASGFHAGSNGASSISAWGFPVVFGTTAGQLSAVGATAPSVSACASLYSVRKTIKQLRWQNAVPFADGYFKGVANTDFLTDIEHDPDFKTWFANAGPIDTIERGFAYRGRLEGVKFYESNNIPFYRATGHSCDLTFIFGEGAYGCTYIGPGEGYEIIIKRPNQYDTSNPFDLWTTMTYKITMASKALNVSAGRILITHSKP